MIGNEDFGTLDRMTEEQLWALYYWVKACEERYQDYRSHAQRQHDLIMDSFYSGGSEALRKLAIQVRSRVEDDKYSNNKVGGGV